MQKHWATASKENGLDKRFLQRTATPGNRTWRIVALEKVAGSSPVGHPIILRIGKPATWKAPGSTGRDRRASAAVSLRGCNRASSGRRVRFQYAFAVYVEEHDALGGLLNHRPVTTLALSELVFRLITFGEVDHRRHLDLALVVGDVRGLSSVGKMAPSSFRRSHAS